MKYVLIALSLTLFSCVNTSSKNQNPTATNNAPPISVKTESYVASGTNRTESTYELSDTDCKISWRATLLTEAGQNSVVLQNLSRCTKPFSEIMNLHSSVLAKIVTDFPKAKFTGLSTGGLRTLQPDGSWNLAVAKAASESTEYQDYRKNYPKHKSKKSSNTILVDLILKTQPHSEFKKMLATNGLFFEVQGVEKVFNSELNGKTVIDDAGIMWWKPVGN